MNATENIDCPNCGATSREKYYELIDYMHKTPGLFNLQRCNSCHLLYLCPRPTPATIMNHYPTDYGPYRRAIQDEKLTIMRWLRRAKIIRHRKMVEQHIDSRGRILDVGCSTGIFLDEMRSSGWDVQGIELNEDAAEYARSHLQLSVLKNDLLELDVQQVGGAASLDAITFWNVLEHTFDPGAILERSKELLRPGGVLAFTVPNWESMDRYLFGRYWIGFDTPRHLFVFPNTTLKQMLQDQGFEIIENCCTFGGYYAFVQSVFGLVRTHLSPITAQNLERLLLFPGLRFPFEPFFMAADRLGIGSIRCIVARKPNDTMFS